MLPVECEYPVKRLGSSHTRRARRARRAWRTWRTRGAGNQSHFHAPVVEERDDGEGVTGLGFVGARGEDEVAQLPVRETKVREVVGGEGRNGTKGRAGKEAVARGDRPRFRLQFVRVEGEAKSGALRKARAHDGGGLDRAFQAAGPCRKAVKMLAAEGREGAHRSEGSGCQARESWRESWRERGVAEGLTHGPHGARA